MGEMKVSGQKGRGPRQQGPRGQKHRHFQGACEHSAKYSQEVEEPKKILKASGCYLQELINDLEKGHIWKKMSKPGHKGYRVTRKQSECGRYRQLFQNNLARGSKERKNLQKYRGGKERA